MMMMKYSWSTRLCSSDEDDDDDVQDSPSYAEPALEHRTDVRLGEVGDATIPQLSVPAVKPTLFPQYRLFTLIYAKYRACSLFLGVCVGIYTASYCRELIFMVN